MFDTWREQFRADRELKRKIKAEQWEQEKQWREEDRAAEVKAREANSVATDEHNEVMRTAAGISYLTLECHEDAWTFIAVAAFGFWQADWVTSETMPANSSTPGPWPYVYEKIRPNPNLPVGRITKTQDGMQEIMLSGHNLVRILDALREGTESDTHSYAARCRTLYGKFADQHPAGRRRTPHRHPDVRLRGHHRRLPDPERTPLSGGNRSGAVGATHLHCSTRPRDRPAGFGHHRRNSVRAGDGDLRGPRPDWPARSGSTGTQPAWPGGGQSPPRARAELYCS
ncbi:hypothetical protein QFZ67_007648 [Streptomyces sp. V1I1]|nr:hypothetical protein [Streptomyces sp. V1I1]